MSGKPTQALKNLLFLQAARRPLCNHERFKRKTLTPSEDIHSGYDHATAWTGRDLHGNLLLRELAFCSSKKMLLMSWRKVCVMQIATHQVLKAEHAGCVQNWNLLGNAAAMNCNYDCDSNPGIHQMHAPAAELQFHYHQHHQHHPCDSCPFRVHDSWKSDAVNDKVQTLTENVAAVTDSLIELIGGAACQDHSVVTLDGGQGTLYESHQHFGVAHQHLKDEVSVSPSLASPDAHCMKSSSLGTNLR